MVHCSNSCKYILSTSSTSSCSESVYQCCCTRACCREQYDFISDRNYAILNRICNKIFKNFNRSKCREKYTIFEGGNSINVKIHRAASRGDGNEHQLKDSLEGDRYRIQHKHDYIPTKENLPQKKQIYGQRSNKNGLMRHDDLNLRIADERKIIPNPKTKKTKKKDCNKNDENVNEKAFYGKDKQKMDKRVEKIYKKRDVIYSDTYQKNKSTKGYRKNIESDESYDSNAAGRKEYTMRRLSEKDKEKKSRLRRDDAFDKEIHKRISKGYNDNNEDGKVANVWNKRNQNFSREKIKIVGNYNAVNDLRAKVRSGDKTSFEVASSLNKLQKSKILTYQHRKNKSSRADEVKASDYLRAKMEQRELCKLCCRLQSRQCIPYACKRKLCVPSCWSNAVVSSLELPSGTCKC